jgi:hypothetical protein
MSDPGQLHRISQLQQAVRESRITISQEYKGLIDDLDVRKKITASVKHHPLRWIGGAALAGLLATLFGSRSSTARRSSPAVIPASSPSGTVGAFPGAGWIAGALEIGRILYPILRPLVVEWIGNAAKSSLGKKGFPR